MKSGRARPARAAERGHRLVEVRLLVHPLGQQQRPAPRGRRGRRARRRPRARAAAQRRAEQALADVVGRVRRVGHEAVVRRPRAARPRRVAVLGRVRDLGEPERAQPPRRAARAEVRIVQARRARRGRGRRAAGRGLGRRARRARRAARRRGVRAEPAQQRRDVGVRLVAGLAVVVGVDRPRARREPRPPSRRRPRRRRRATAPEQRAAPRAPRARPAARPPTRPRRTRPSRSPRASRRGAPPWLRGGSRAPPPSPRPRPRRPRPQPRAARPQPRRQASAGAAEGALVVASASAGGAAAAAASRSARFRRFRSALDRCPPAAAPVARPAPRTKRPAPRPRRAARRRAVRRRRRPVVRGLVVLAQLVGRELALALRRDDAAVVVDLGRLLALLALEALVLAAVLLLLALRQPDRPIAGAAAWGFGHRRSRPKSQTAKGVQRHSDASDSIPHIVLWQGQPLFHVRAWSPPAVLSHVGTSSRARAARAVSCRAVRFHGELH